MITPESSSSRLRVYSTLACGATAVIAGNAEAATIVPINSGSYDTGLSNLGTVQSTNIVGDKGYLNFSGSGVSVPSANGFFQRGSDTTNVNLSGSGTSFRFSDYVAPQTIPQNGAQLSSNDNWFYAVGSTDNTQRMWLQLEFGSQSNVGFSIVKAVIPSFAGELPNAAAASAVPETSSLALLSLGAAGLLKRRRRAA